MLRYYPEGRVASTLPVLSSVAGFLLLCLVSTHISRDRGSYGFLWAAEATLRRIMAGGRLLPGAAVPSGRSVTKFPRNCT